MLVVGAAQSLPEVTCILIESPVVAKYLGQGLVGFVCLLVLGTLMTLS